MTRRCGPSVLRDGVKFHDGSMTPMRIWNLDKIFNMTARKPDMPVRAVAVPAERRELAARPATWATEITAAVDLLPSLSAAGSRISVSAQ